MIADRWRLLFIACALVNLISAAVNVWVGAYWLLPINATGFYFTVTAWRRMLHVERLRQTRATKGCQRP